MSEISFMLGYTVFLFFILLILPMTPFPDIVSMQGNITIAPPICQIGGLFAVFDVIICAVSNLGFLLSLIGISTAVGYGWLWSLLFAPMIITFIWMLVRMLRGYG